MEFIYREQSLTQLSEMALRLQKVYSIRHPQREVEIIKESGKVDSAQLDKKKVSLAGPTSNCSFIFFCRTDIHSSDVRFSLL